MKKDSFTTTFKPNAKNFPDKNKIDNSSIRKYAYNNTSDLLIQQYNDKKTIYFATNYEDTTSKIRNIYNFENRGVGKLNQYISYNSLDRNVISGGKNFFFGEFKLQYQIHLFYGNFQEMIII